MKSFNGISAALVIAYKLAVVLSNWLLEPSDAIYFSKNYKGMSNHLMENNGKPLTVTLTK